MTSKGTLLRITVFAGDALAPDRQKSKIALKMDVQCIIFVGFHKLWIKKTLLQTVAKNHVHFLRLIYLVAN